MVELILSHNDVMSCNAFLFQAVGKREEPDIQGAWLYMDKGQRFHISTFQVTDTLNTPTQFQITQTHRVYYGTSGTAAGSYLKSTYSKL